MNGMERGFLGGVTWGEGRKVVWWRDGRVDRLVDVLHAQLSIDVLFARQDFAAMELQIDKTRNAILVLR